MRITLYLFDISHPKDTGGRRVPLRSDSVIVQGHLASEYAEFYRQKLGYEVWVKEIDIEVADSIGIYLLPVGETAIPSAGAP